MAIQGPVQIPWRADFAVGWGISGFSGQPAPKPWAFEDSARLQLNQLQDPSDAVPGNIRFQQGVVSSSCDYERAIKAAVSLSVKAWGPLSGQTSADFLSSMEMNSKTVHYVVVSSFETATTNVLTQQSFSPSLSGFAAALLAEIGPDRWSEQFGTHFIAGYVLGGQLIGKASLISGSQASALKLKGSLEAKFGCFGSGQAQSSAQRTESLDHCETKIQYHCIGARMSNTQPGDADGMIAAARDYAQNNRGGKYHAILWPFSALNSYNIAEHKYHGHKLQGVQAGGHLLKMLNMEYARLQRLEHTLAGVCKPGSSAVAAVQKLNRALRGFDRLEGLANLATVDEDATEYDAALHNRIFVAEEVEGLLQLEQLSVAEIPSSAPHIAAEQTASGGFRFDICDGGSLTQAKTEMSGDGSACLLAPTLQSGKVYFLKFEVLKHSARCSQLFFGVTTNTDPAGKWLSTDSGWFLPDDSGQHCKLTGLQWIHDAAFDGWKQGDMPVFKVDLVANVLHVWLDRLGKSVRVPIKDPPPGAMFFCVTMHSSKGIVSVRLLPVASVDLF